MHPCLLIYNSFTLHIEGNSYNIIVNLIFSNKFKLVDLKSRKTYRRIFGKYKKYDDDTNNAKKVCSTSFNFYKLVFKKLLITIRQHQL